ncbi:TetR/AcrR family transcriptional regulator [Craterilacuibacter sp. RT1T]|uniref:TetR/AcrR family transcriptional regulator n=1 Tax=Craterilacuibacter sp. RT1T TaxID=2942211 RepID=UPI0020BF039F|nr:TetR/AcrR family transcriptional regulator [Craterilacuibacter sp. RT1T]MCL6261792.1 TetR/AcrR family transcriptional regulator [Craterilacuibacter sp. RT1T]
MTETQAVRWQRRKEVRPGEILDAALALFVEKGYSATKIDDIARAAGVTKGTPYLYFPSKADILKAVVREKLLERVADMENLSRAHPGTPATLIRLLLLKWWDDVGATPLSGLCKLMVAEAVNFPELARFYHDEVIIRSRAIALRLVQQGMDSGEFVQGDAEAAVDALLAPLLMTMIWRHSFACIPGCEIYRGEPKLRLQAAIDLVLAGLARPE